MPDLLRFLGARRPSDELPSLAESYRIMRTNLLGAIADIERPTILFTSATAGEGKTSTITNLAPVLALTGSRVVVVDLDLRHPQLHRLLGLGNDRGATDVLRGEAALADCLQYVAVKSETGQPEQGMYVLTSGPVPSDPTELLADRRAARMLDALIAQSDVVLVDGPPVLPVADSLMLARTVAGVVLVVEARRTPLPTLQRAKDTLIRNQARLLGVVINKVRQQDAAALDGGTNYS
jgi:capsular exopolysaccharide synthesis family protein